MKRRTPWTVEERNSFIVWHETVVRQYPKELMNELRQYRHKMLGSVRILKNETSPSQ